MYIIEAITKQGWDKLTPAEKKKYAKQHPNSNFSRALNLSILRVKAKEISGKIAQLKVDIVKYKSKAKKLQLTQSIKYNTTRLSNIKAEIVRLQKLLAPSNQGTVVKVPSKPKVSKEPITKTKNYDKLPMPVEDDYMDKRWKQSKQKIEKLYELEADEDALRRKHLDWTNQHKDVDFTQLPEYQQYHQKLGDLFEECMKLKKSFKPYDNMRYRQMNFIASLEDSNKRVRSNLFKYLDKCMTSQPISPKEFNEIKQQVSQSIDDCGIDYFIALVNTNEDYGDYWDYIEKHPEKRSLMVPIMTLFDEEQVTDDSEFSTVQQQNEYLATLAPTVHLNSINDKRPICEQFKELESKYVPFRVDEIKTTNQKYSIARINLNTLSLNADSFNNAKLYENETHREFLKGQIKRANDILTDNPDLLSSERRQVLNKIKALEESLKYRWFTFRQQGKLESKYTITHEYGHYLSFISRWADSTGNMIQQVYNQVYNSNLKYKLTEYSMSNREEFFAECFNMYHYGEPLPDICKNLVETVIEKAKQAYKVLHGEKYV